MAVVQTSNTIAPRLVTLAGDVYETAPMVLVPLGATEANIDAILTDAGPGATITFTPGDYQFDTASWGSTVQDDQTLICTGAVFYINHSGAGVDLGSSGANIKRVVVESPTVRRGTIGGFTTSWSPGNVGLRLRNADYCKVLNVRSEGHFDGVQIYSVGGRGSSYNLVTVKNVASNLNHLTCWSDGAGSWVNENEFREGSAGYGTSDPDSSSGYHIVLNAANGGDAPNNNRFHHIALESGPPSAGAPAAAIFNNGQWNVFSFLRFEGTWATGDDSDPATMLIEEGSSALGRSTYGPGCHGFVGPSNVAAHTFGSPISATTHYSTILANDGCLMSGAVVGTSILTLNGLNSTTDPALEITYRGTNASSIDTYGRIKITPGSTLDLSTARSLIDVAPDVAATARPLVRIVVPSGSPAQGLAVQSVGTGDCIRAGTVGAEFRVMADGSINCIANTSTPHYLNIIKAVTLSAFDGHVTIGQTTFTPVFTFRETSSDAKRTIQFTNTAGNDCTYFDGQGRFISSQSVDLGGPAIVIAPNTAQTGAGHLQLFMPSGTTIPGLVLGTAGTGDLLQANGTQCRISSAGAMQVVPSLVVGSPTSYDGVRVFVIGNRATAPTTVVGGGVLFADAGALKWLGSSGTTTTIAPA